jgi:hypothetical protein
MCAQLYCHSNRAILSALHMNGEFKSADMGIFFIEICLITKPNWMHLGILGTRGGELAAA